MTDYDRITGKDRVQVGHSGPGSGCAGKLPTLCVYLASGDGSFDVALNHTLHEEQGRQRPERDDEVHGTHAGCLFRKVRVALHHVVLIACFPRLCLVGLVGVTSAQQMCHSCGGKL